MRAWVICSAASLALAGCNGLTTVERTDQAVITGTANDRHVYFLPGRADGTGGATDRAALCPEPSPDAALQQVFNTSARANGRGENAPSAEAKLEYETSVVQLAGRTQTVLLARDFMFNVCIMRANGYLDDKEAFALYGQTIDLVREIAASDRAQSVANAVRAGAQPESVTTLGFGNDRTLTVLALTQFLADESAADRKTFLDRALNCASIADVDQKQQCDDAIDALDDQTDVIVLRREVSRLTNAQLMILKSAIERTGA